PEYVHKIQKTLHKTVSLKRSVKKISTSSPTIELTKNNLRHKATRPSNIIALMSLKVLPTCKKISQRLGCVRCAEYVCACIGAFLLLNCIYVIRPGCLQVVHFFVSEAMCTFFRRRRHTAIMTQSKLLARKV